MLLGPELRSAPLPAVAGPGWLVPGAGAAGTLALGRLTLQENSRLAPALPPGGLRRGSEAAAWLGAAASQLRGGVGAAGAGVGMAGGAVAQKAPTVCRVSSVAPQGPARQVLLSPPPGRETKVGRGAK